MTGEEAEHTWRNKSIYDSWIDYYASQKANDEKVLSYVSGTYDAKAGKAPKRIRNAADNAKSYHRMIHRGLHILAVLNRQMMLPVSDMRICSICTMH